MAYSKIKVGIPEDVAVEILARLPVKSLLRFRCVCKAWNQLVLDSNFMAKHRNLKNNEGIAIFNHYRNRLSLLSSSFENDSKKIFSVVTSTNAPCEYAYHHERYNTPHILIASCNGLLCICEDGIGITLWNPATREFKHLPVLYVLPLSPTIAEVGDTLFWFGFGFDTQTNDYKVLRFHIEKYTTQLSEEYETEIVAAYYRVELYSLNHDFWKIIQPFEDHHEYQLYYYTYNANEGICYWLAIKYDGTGGHCIMSFDMTSESFRKIPLPECVILTDMIACNRLGTVDGCLAVVIGNHNEFLSTYYDVWILSKDVWLKRASCGPLPTIMCLAVWNDDALCLEDDYGQLFMYTLKDQHQHLKIVKGIEPDPRKLQFASYSECLVPIDGVKYYSDEEFVPYMNKNPKPTTMFFC